MKIKDSVGLKKIENKNRQFLVEKIIHSVEFQNLYENSVEKKLEDDIKSNGWGFINKILDMDNFVELLST